MFLSLNLSANERVYKPSYKISVDLDKPSVIIKIPRKCNKYFPNFGKFSESCDISNRIDKDKILATSLFGYVSLSESPYHFYEDNRVDFFESSVDAKQKIYHANVDLRQIINLRPRVLNDDDIEQLYPFLISVKVIVKLWKKGPDREEVVQLWTIKLTKNNPKITIQLPSLDAGGIETNTYNINALTECIDGKVWVKKYGALSGDTCGWVKEEKDNKSNYR